MLIAVDCGHLVEQDRTGTENYLYNLLKQLAVVDTANDYLLYFKSAPSAGFWLDICGQRANWRYRVLASAVSWEQLALARATFADKPDRLLCTWHTLPIIHTPHTRVVSVIHDFSCPALRSYPLYASLLLSHKLVGVSDYTYREIVKRVPWRHSSIYKQYEGVDLAKYTRSPVAKVLATQKKYGLTRSYFLSVGTLTARKNLERMLAAFARFAQEHKSIAIDYVLVGKCALGYENIYDYAKGLGLGDKIKFLGRLADKEVIDLYSSSLALLYVSNAEGFGLPILEAAACGCTVITANISSTREIGADFVILADPGSVASINKALWYVTDPKNRPDLEGKKQKGLLASAHYSWTECASFFKNIY